jgi:hypothetical protein
MINTKDKSTDRLDSRNKMNSTNSPKTIKKEKTR